MQCCIVSHECYVCLTTRIFIDLQFIYLSLIYTTPVTSSTIRQSISELNDINEICYCKQSSSNDTASVKLIDLLIILHMWWVTSGRWMMMMLGGVGGFFYNFIELMHNWILFINLIHLLRSLVDMWCRHIQSLLFRYTNYYAMPKICENSFSSHANFIFIKIYMFSFMVCSAIAYAVIV